MAEGVAVAEDEHAAEEIVEEVAADHGSIEGSNVDQVSGDQMIVDQGVANIEGVGQDVQAILLSFQRQLDGVKSESKKREAELETRITKQEENAKELEAELVKSKKREAELETRITKQEENAKEQEERISELQESNRNMNDRLEVLEFREAVLLIFELLKMCKDLLNENEMWHQVGPQERGIINQMDADLRKIRNILADPLRRVEFINMDWQTMTNWLTTRLRGLSPKAGLAMDAMQHIFADSPNREKPLTGVTFNADGKYSFRVINR